MKKVIKKTRRNSTKNPGLVKEVNLKIRHELMDYDYLDKLSPEEKDWLNRFTEEYVHNNFSHPGKRIHPKKTRKAIVKKTGEPRKIDIYKKESGDRNNARNRDSYSITKSNNILEGEAKLNVAIDARKTTRNDVEERMVELLDEHFGNKTKV